MAELEILKHLPPFLNFYRGGEKSKSWLQFLTAVTFESPAFQNKAVYLKSKTKKR